MYRVSHGISACIHMMYRFLHGGETSVARSGDSSCSPIASLNWGQQRPSPQTNFTCKPIEMDASANPVPCGGATVSFETTAVGVSAEGPSQKGSQNQLSRLYADACSLKYVGARPRLCQGQWPLRIRHVPRQGAMCDEK